MCSVYADDICMWAAHNELSVLTSIFRSALETLAANLRRTGLKLAPEECYFMHINRRLAYRFCCHVAYWKYDFPFSSVRSLCAPCNVVDELAAGMCPASPARKRRRGGLQHSHGQAFAFCIGMTLGVTPMVPQITCDRGTCFGQTRGRLWCRRLRLYPRQ